MPVGQQDPAGRGDIAAESSSSSGAPGPSGESGLTADQAGPSYHLPVSLDVSDGSGVSHPRSPSPARCGRCIRLHV